MDDKKRLFFGFEINVPWPTTLPHGKVLLEEDRHLTIAFLGDADYAKLSPLLPAIPLPAFKVGPTGFFEKFHFLPKRHPHVVAWEVTWFDQELSLNLYVQSLKSWLKERDFSVDDKGDILFHVTLARAPFEFSEWRKVFKELPIAVCALHLYESLGHSHYRSLHSYPLIRPFEEIEHTADIAFLVRGESLEQLYFHALTALAFKSHELLKYRAEKKHMATIDDVIIELNHNVAQTDAAIGCPFKAISFHGDVEDENGILTWEMIVDV